MAIETTCALIFDKSNHCWREMSSVSSSINAYAEGSLVSHPFEIKFDVIPWLHKAMMSHQICRLKIQIGNFFSHSSDLSFFAYLYVVFDIPFKVGRLKTLQRAIFIVLFLCRFIWTFLKLPLSVCNGGSSYYLSATVFVGFQIWQFNISGNPIFQDRSI